MAVANELTLSLTGEFARADQVVEHEGKRVMNKGDSARVVARDSANILTKNGVVAIDTDAGTVTWPGLIALWEDGSQTAVPSPAAKTTLALSANNTPVYYYMDLAADPQAIVAGSRPAATEAHILLGSSRNGAFENRFMLPEVWTPGQVMPDILMAFDQGDMIVVDSALKTVDCPDIFYVNLQGANAVATGATLTLATTGAQNYFFGLNAATGTVFQSTEEILPTATIWPIGVSRMGTVTFTKGLRVRYKSEPVASAVSTEEAIWRMGNAQPVPDQFAGRKPILVSSGGVIQVSPYQPKAIVYVNEADCVVDLTNLSHNCEVTIVAKKKCKVFAGPTRTFWPDNTNGLDLLQTEVVTVLRAYNELWVTSNRSTGPNTTINMADLAHTRSILYAGQSQDDNGFKQGMIGGFVEGLRDTAWVGSPAINVNYGHIDGATGSSRLLKSGSYTGSNNETNFWVNDDDPQNLVDGPAMLTCKTAVTDAIAAGFPVPDLVKWAQGEAEVADLESGASTIAEKRVGLDYVITELRAFLMANGASNPKVFSTPLGSYSVSPDLKGGSAVRAMYLSFIQDNSSWAYLADEMGDLPRSQNELHLNELGSHLRGLRFARAVAVHEFGRSLDLGPAAGTRTLAADGLSATLQFTGTGIQWPDGDIDTDIHDGPHPLSIGAFHGEIGANDPVELVQARVNRATNTITFYSETNLTGARLIGPIGRFPDWWKFRFLRNNIDHLGYGVRGLPMRSFVTEPLV